MKLIDYAENRYSQFGEDGIVAKALEIIGVDDGFVVEFGAGDGLHLSNTAQFWKDRGWSALLIESDPDRFVKVDVEARAARDATALLGQVNPTGGNSIDQYLSRHPRGDDVDFMSIDVDDCEYQIFREMESRPKLVLVEFNYTMPHHLELVGAEGSLLQASPLALVRLAESKGYSLLSISGCNCLFVRQPLDQLFLGFDTDYWNLVDREASTFVVTDWHGKYVFIGPKPHGMTEPYVEPNWEQGPQ